MNKFLKIIFYILFIFPSFVLADQADGLGSPEEESGNNLPEVINTQIPSPTRTATQTATQTATRTATQTATQTATRTATQTATQTATPTATQTPTRTATPTATQTATATPTSAPMGLRCESVAIGEGPSIVRTGDLSSFVMRTADGRYIQNGRYVDPTNPEVNRRIDQFTDRYKEDNTYNMKRGFNFCYRNPYFDDSHLTNTSSIGNVTRDDYTYYINDNCERDNLIGAACDLRAYQVLKNFLDNDLNEIFRSATDQCIVCLRASTLREEASNFRPPFSYIASSSPEACVNNDLNRSSNERSTYIDNVSQYNASVEAKHLPVCVRNPYFKPINQRLPSEPRMSAFAFRVEHSNESTNIADKKAKLFHLVHEFGRKNVGACNICVHQ